MRELLATVAERKWLILGVASIVALLALFWTLRQPKIFEAECTLEYDPTPPRPLGAEVHDVADPVGSYWASVEYFRTQNEILQSRSVAERAVRELGLHRDPGFVGVPEEERDGWRGISVELAADRLRSRLAVEQEQETRIVTVSFRDEDPERAQLVVNTIVDGYLEKLLEDRLGTTVSALAWLQEQLDDLKGELEGSELALHQFKRDNNILSVSLEDRQNIIANDIRQFSQALTETRARRIELQARLGVLRRATEDPEIASTVLEQNETLGTLRTELQRLQSQRASENVSRGTNHPMVRELTAQIEVLEEKIAEEIARVTASVAGDLAEVRRTETGLGQALQEANERGLDLNLLEIEYTRLHRERENSSELHELLLQRTAQTNLTKAMRVDHVRVVDEALLPTRPVSPKLSLNLAAGTFLGLVLGIVIALGIDHMDRTIRAPSDIESTGLTVLGVVPAAAEEGAARKRKRRRRVAGPMTDRDLIAYSHPMSSIAEHCRAIRTNLTFMSPEKPFEVLVVTSPGPREGKTTFATNLAITLAQAGDRVLLIDTDLRRPRIHKTFHTSLERGVTSILVGEHSLSDAVQETEIGGLDVLVAGPVPPNPSELLHVTRFRDLLAEARRRYDRVILDSPPVGAVTDAAIIAPRVDATVVVVRGQQTHKEELRLAVRQLRDVGARIAGVVLNDLDVSRRSYGYGGYYYQRKGYYSSRDDEPNELHETA
ncbi:MAG TPA: polysaccharide biosynthesis tyrosine autokinase [Polyangiaceae bacterium LLY-WYZ-15_(1-7)]|nr:polysaccharide biosynthesis tyrosine autokinase [Polyangiaceae bacterium LLY-WYZ-15_(1-7)]HJL11794.1 polysaccharide biosynthesis tyrosine autokinase [Polyangiaceae bacterium LLY-WYZ-15_(1-7)]HJL21859.1 polysaccharide biosynthesis tyrosine autokinase [Polyangiaceae bacterium LLY-WYZ-15_(1-7)]HJL34421.1 polysaccharide biosynthesis tyrosine autokinase [Polyangiaceae bacterium LLY-WYZ-15_(1-7)]